MSEITGVGVGGHYYFIKRQQDVEEFFFDRGWIFVPVLIGFIEKSYYFFSPCISCYSNK